MRLIIFMAAAMFFSFFCIQNSANLDYVLEHGERRWIEVGYEPVAYEGYQWCRSVFFSEYGGACVWWRLRNIPDNGITYTGYLKRWGDELHVYGPFAIDAIKP